MKSEILSILNNESMIFRDRSVFEISYIPEVWRYREKQYKLMATYCKSLSDDVAPHHLLLTGGFATGKTTTLKQFLNLLNDNFSNVRTVYINCKLSKTEYSILSEIYKQVMYINKPINGYNKRDLFSKVISEISEKKQILIVAFDDFDDLKNKAELNNILYKLLRVHETNSSVQISIFRVSNMGDLLIDDIVSTVYQEAEIVFNDYTLDQVYKILEERCSYGFVDNVIDENTLRIITERTFYRKDLRYGLRLLSQLGDLAEVNDEKVVRFRQI